MDRSMPNENANNPFDKAASVPVDYAGSQAVYSTWAAKYEEDMADMGYNGPRQIVALMHQVLGGVNPSSVRVLDVPAGTGMVGSELQKLGYTNADGLDANPDMLKVAENKHVYQRLIEAKLGTGQLPVAPNTYDAVLLVGAFTQNGTHLPCECLDDLVQITKPDGHIIVGTGSETLQSDVGAALVAKLQDLQERALLSIVDRTTRPGYFRDWEGTFFVCRVTS
ncbi:methyltransferase-like protein 27 isoform X1 [Branchiostoma lanceolatum]|uniref:methyltransferase-like protein 27 isoform X1 n=1 Tax=Branchiostoma lanceolatum TaxID=7740 RepID=UPI003452D100